jgi:hypothetical protein
LIEAQPSKAMRRIDSQPFDKESTEAVEGDVKGKDGTQRKPIV